MINAACRGKLKMGDIVLVCQIGITSRSSICESHRWIGIVHVTSRLHTVYIKKPSDTEMYSPCMRIERFNMRFDVWVQQWGRENGGRGNTACQKDIFGLDLPVF